MPFDKYTGVIGKAIGSVVGAYFGGPAGAYAGGMAGQMEGDKFGDVIRGDSDFTTLFSPGPAPQKPPAPPMPPTLLDPQGRTGNRMAPEVAPEIGPLENAPATRANMAEPTNGGGGFDWGGLISGVGRTLSGTAAGMRGDNDYFTRLQTQMDNAAERARRTKLAEEELKSRNEERAITSSKNVMEMLKMAQEVADQAGGDPERARLPGQIIKTLLERNLEGGKIDEKQWQDFMTGGAGSFDGILAAYEGITAAGLDKTPGFRQALKTGKIDLKEWDKTGRSLSSDVAYKAASQFAQEHPEEAKKMTWDQFQEKIPKAKFASEDDILRLQSEHGYTIKAPAQLKKEAERTAGGDTRTALSAARLVTGREIKTLDDLTPEEKVDLRSYEDAGPYQADLNILKQQNPNKRMSELLPQARADFNKNKQGLAITIAGGAAQAAVQGRERGYQSVINERLDRITREKEAEASGRPLDQPDRVAISAMEQTVKIAGQIKDEYTPDELKKYIGQFRRPLAQIKELARADPKFERLNSLIMKLKATAFSEGGKQLTPFEAGITFGHIPTGDEFSTEQFVSKLDTTVEQTTDLIRERYKKAQTGRGSLAPNLSQTKPGGGGQQQPGGRDKLNNLLDSEIKAAKKRLGID